jgi:hypothetical protein
LKCPPWHPSKSHHQFHRDVPLPNELKEWPLVAHPSLQSLNEQLAMSRLLCIRGQQRIGKTQLLHSLCDKLDLNSQHYIFLNGTRDESVWMDSVNEALSQFDNAIGRVQTKKQSVECLYWLVISGVWVIIDEFEELNAINLISVLQFCCDVKQDISGKLLLVAGANMTEVDHIFSSAGYLYASIRSVHC